MKEDIKNHRKLGTSEYFFWLLDQVNCANHTVFAEINGNIDTIKLQKAINIVIQNNHVLSSKIIIKNRKAYFELIPLKERKVLLEIKNDKNWLNDIENLLDSSFTVGSYPLIKFVLYKISKNKNVLALIIHHSIADAIAGVSILKEILHLTFNNYNNQNKPKYFQGNLEKLYPAKYKSVFAFLKVIFNYLRLFIEITINGMPQELQNFKNISLQKRDIQIIPIKFDKNKTENLIKNSHRNNTTIQGAIGAAVLLAVLPELNKKNKTTMALSTPVNLRNSLKKSITDNNIGTYLGFTITIHKLKKNNDFWKIARSYKNKLNKNIKHGDAHLIWKSIIPGFYFPDKKGAISLNKSMELIPPAIIISNIGIIEIKKFDNIKVDSISFAFCPASRYSFALSLSSFNNSLFLYITFSKKALQEELVKRISERIRLNLIEASKAF